MSVVCKSSAVLACVCMLAPVAFAQNKTVIIKYLNPKQDVRKTLQNITRVPSKYAQINELSEIRRINFQNTVLDGLELGIERSALQQARVQHQAAQQIPVVKLSELGHQSSLSHEQLQTQAEHQTEFIVQYLREHKNRWPVYAPRSEEAHLLKCIANFMEVENPPLDVIYIQQEIIRLRASSKARSPQEILSIVQDMMRYGMVPSRAYMSEEEKHTPEELQVGEDLAFAIAAYKVPMKDNPWKMPQMQEVADKTATHNAMRRTDPLFEGLPQMHVEDGIHQPNFPVWTRSEFTWHQQEWVHKHPFEYALALYWEKTFGRSLYRIYNHLTEIEKQAIMFATPKLPAVADTTSELFAPYYDKALQQWINTHNRAPASRVDHEKEEYLGAVLAGTQPYHHALQFKDIRGRYVDFVDLDYPTQVEVLMWVWQKYQIVPANALGILEKSSQPYF